MLKKKLRINKFKEPRLRFGFGQMAEDPRDGLTLFGPFDRGKTNSFNIGIIGTKDGIRKCRHWLLNLNKPIYHPTADIANPFFPGFEEIFQVSINQNATTTIDINEDILDTFYRYTDNHVRVGEIVNLY